MNTSQVLGIIGMCISWLIPIGGIILGIIGLCIKKQKGKEKRDRILNIIAIAGSVLFWLIYTWALTLVKFFY